LTASEEGGYEGGIKTVIIGKPNAGKSSLLNALLGSTGLSNILAGTTRDTIEEKLILGDNLLRLFDTAGLRQSSDEAELLGIEALKKAAKRLILYLLCSTAQSLFLRRITRLLRPQGQPPFLGYINKNDLKCALDVCEIKKYYNSIVFVSALKERGLTLFPL
jgi:tRNA modification GTPase